jgi:hypothetical protein
VNARTPLNSGVASRFVDTNGAIIGPAWYRAWEGKDIVGTCRQLRCDGLMVALPNQQEDRHVWYGAHCLSCGHEIAVREDKTIGRRSSRHQEMPEGTWAQRTEHLKKLAELGKREAA